MTINPYIYNAEMGWSDQYGNVGDWITAEGERIQRIIDAEIAAANVPPSYTLVGTVMNTAQGIVGDIYRDAAGQFYVEESIATGTGLQRTLNYRPIPWTAQQVEAEIAARSLASEQGRDDEDAFGTLMMLAAVAVAVYAGGAAFGLWGQAVETAVASGAVTAGEAAAIGESAATAAWYGGSAAEVAAVTAYEAGLSAEAVAAAAQAVAAGETALTAGIADLATSFPIHAPDVIQAVDLMPADFSMMEEFAAQDLLHESALQASMQAEEYAALATQAAEAAPANVPLQTAASNAVKAANTVKTIAEQAAANSGTVTATTAASVFSNIKTALGLAASAVGVVTALSRATSKSTLPIGASPYPPGYNPLTQQYGTGISGNTMLPLLALGAGFLLLKG